MKRKLFTLATQTTGRANLMKEYLEKRGVKCTLEEPFPSQEEKEQYSKVRVKIQDYSRSLALAQEIDRQYGKEEIEIPEEEPIRKILVPIVFKDYSLNACGYALRMADKLQAEVKLFHSYYNPFTNPESYSEDLQSGGYFDNYVYRIEEEAKQRLEQVTKDLRKEAEEHNMEGVKIDYELGAGAIYSELQNTMKSYEPDLVVIGTKGHHKKHSDLMGQFTVKLIENLDTPVLAVPEDTTYDTIDNLNILHVTNFDSSDYIALHKLLNMSAAFNPKIHCVHMEKHPDTHKLDTEMDKLKGFFDKYYSSAAVECAIVKGSDVLKDLQELIHQKNINMISITRHKHNILLQWFKRDQARKIIFHTHLPLLVYPS